VEAAFTMRDRAMWLKRVDRMLATMSWDRTWERMQAAIAGVRQPAGKEKAAYV
jgi:hypothetical protein